MNVILYMAITVNGMIAKKNGNSEWTSLEDTKEWLSVCRNTGAVIMGRYTYEYLTKDNASDNLPLQKGIQIVMTSDKSIIARNSTVLFTDKSPRAVLKMLEEKGYSKVCIIGGSKIVSEFMQENLVDEIYLDIEPLLFGKGMPIFQDSDFEYRLELMETCMLNANTLHLHYKVLKNR